MTMPPFFYLIDDTYCPAIAFLCGRLSIKVALFANFETQSTLSGSKSDENFIINMNH
jgi:hypothetical protein